ncbi:MAG: hypothetical protein IIA67_01985 [Planctomycetes bacterium]|nr:hypothetical protein [Planctomycetota bacterium]
MAENGISLETYQWADEVVRIGNRAVQRAQEESRRLGVPNVYSINGFLYYELPNGELSREDPYSEPKGEDEE